MKASKISQTWSLAVWLHWPSRQPPESSSLPLQSWDAWPPRLAFHVGHGDLDLGPQSSSATMLLTKPPFQPHWGQFVTDVKKGSRS